MIDYWCSITQMPSNVTQYNYLLGQYLGDRLRDPCRAVRAIGHVFCRRPVRG
jgi:hypothetical protein